MRLIFVFALRVRVHVYAYLCAYVGVSKRFKKNSQFVKFVIIVVAVVFQHKYDYE